MSPVIEADSIDRSIVFAASRYGKGDGDDYLNCPMNREEYEQFVAELVTAEPLSRRRGWLSAIFPRHPRPSFF